MQHYYGCLMKKFRIYFHPFSDFHSAVASALGSSGRSRVGRTFACIKALVAFALLFLLFNTPHIVMVCSRRL